MVRIYRSRFKGFGLVEDYACVCDDCKAEATITKGMADTAVPPADWKTDQTGRVLRHLCPECANLVPA